MGKQISVSATSVVGEVAVFDTDRSITGQDGTGFASAADAASGETFPARLATRLFDAVPGLSHVFVASSQVVLRRDPGWDPASLQAAGNVVSGFFVFYVPLDTRT